MLEKHPLSVGTEAVDPVERCCAERLRKFEESVRRSPGCYVLSAAVLGYFLQFLPVGCILGGLARIALAAIRPALLILGVLKIVECAREKCALSRSPASSRREEREPLVDSPVGPAGL